jgi:hypothetical protein
VEDELKIDVTELELGRTTLELIGDEVLAWLDEAWGALTEDTGRIAGEAVLEELWDADGPGTATEIPMLVNDAWLIDAAREVTLDDAEAASTRVVPGTLTDDTLRLLLLGASEVPVTELLDSETGTVTADEIVLELDRMLDDAIPTDEETASCEEGTMALTVGRGTVSAVLLLEAPNVLDAIADWERPLEMTGSVAEELWGLADENSVWLVLSTGMTPILVLPALTLTT